MFFCEWVVVWGNGFVVWEWRKGSREEFAIFVGLTHVFDELGFEAFVLLGFILFIEDAVFFVIEADTAEQIV